MVESCEIRNPQTLIECKWNRNLAQNRPETATHHEAISHSYPSTYCIRMGDMMSALVLHSHRSINQLLHPLPWWAPLPMGWVDTYGTIGGLTLEWISYAFSSMMPSKKGDLRHVNLRSSMDLFHVSEKMRDVVQCDVGFPELSECVHLRGGHCATKWHSVVSQSAGKRSDKRTPIDQLSMAFLPYSHDRIPFEVPTSGDSPASPHPDTSNGPQGVVPPVEPQQGDSKIMGKLEVFEVS